MEIPAKTTSRDAATIAPELSVRDEVRQLRARIAALEDENQLANSLFQHSQAGIYRTSPDGRILLVNPRLLTILGYTSIGELQTRNLETDGFGSGYDRRTFRDLLEQRGVIRDHEATWKRRDGARISVLETAVLVRDSDGVPLYYEGTIQDITERKRAQEALKESEERFAQLAEHSQTITWEVNALGLYTYVSPVSESSWGYRPDEIVGRMHFYDLHPEAGREEYKAALFSVTRQGQPFRDVVHAVQAKMAASSGAPRAVFRCGTRTEPCGATEEVAPTSPSAEEPRRP